MSKLDELDKQKLKFAGKYFGFDIFVDKYMPEDKVKFMGKRLSNQTEDELPPLSARSYYEAGRVEEREALKKKIEEMRNKKRTLDSHLILQDLKNKGVDLEAGYDGILSDLLNELK